MFRAVIIMPFIIATLMYVFAAPNVSSPRVIGGATTTINSYPYMTSLIYASSSVYTQYCAGSILTTTAILTAAQCIVGKNYYKVQARVGSSYANSGGVTHSFRQVNVHPNYNSQSLDSDIAVLRTATVIKYIPQTVASATIAAPSYNLKDNEQVWAVGWGYITQSGPASELLRHVQIWSVNQIICSIRYAELGLIITDNMLCSGWLDVGGRDQCTGDSGGPLLHQNVIVGICSWGHQCALPRYPGVNTRVSRFTSWIQSVAA